MQQNEPFHACRICFMSSLLFILEFSLFHVLQYTTNYLESTLIISFALLGIGLGGLINPVIKLSENKLFILCILGCWVFLLLTVIKIVLFPSLGFTSFIPTFLFFFPGLYLARMFNAHASQRVYFFDLWAAGASVLFLTGAYLLLSSEYIILMIFVLLSVIGLLTAGQAGHLRKGWVPLFLVLLIISESLFLWHYNTNDLDLFNLSKNGKNFNPDKSFFEDLSLIKSYDNLISRVEVLLTSQSPHRFCVSYFGFVNDVFNKGPQKDIQDSRLVYGLIENPRIYIIGSSAEGIVKTAKMMTAPHNIDGIEINPSVYQIMTKDFAGISDAPYSGTNIKLGNAIADLKSKKTQYDLITMMNAHSTPRIFYLGPPDFLHTKEFYKTIFNHLSSRGYLMFEERPWGGQGKYALYRLIVTLYQTLKGFGIKNPEQHFFIYNFIYSNSFYTARQSLKDDLYTGLLVQKRALSENDIVKIKQWASSQRLKCSIDFLNDNDRNSPYQQLFTSIKNHRLSIDYAGWDLSELTNDRPFPAAADPQYPQLRFIFLYDLLLTLLLLLLISYYSSRNQSQALLNFRFLFFQTAIGLAYMMVEGLFMNIYQKEFISPSLAFICTLTPLLASSAVGGKILNKIRKPWTIVALVTISFAFHWLLMFPLADFLTLGPRIIVIITLISMSGFLMGYFFPFGLTLAKEKGLGANVGYYFACNCIAGAFAVVFSYFMSVQLGFSAVFFIAVFLYMIAVIFFCK